MVDVVLGRPGRLDKSGPGTALLTRTNTFTGDTTISGGVLQADFGAALPASSFLSLDGGVLETLAGGTFTRSFGGGGSGSFQMTYNGGGFSTAGGPLVVNVGGSGATLGLGLRHRFAVGRPAEVLLADLHQLGDPGQSHRSQRRGADDPGRQQSELDGRLRRALRRDHRFGRRRRAGEDRRRHALSARFHVEQLLRSDDDHGHAGGREDRRGGGHSRQRHLE